jgi:hypothetical protein
VNEISWGDGLFRPFDKLVQIEFCGVPIRVPENNTVLRCLQFYRPDALSSGQYCWNGDCTSCQIWLREDDAVRSFLGVPGPGQVRNGHNQREFRARLRPQTEGGIDAPAIADGLYRYLAIISVNASIALSRSNSQAPIT